jgi:hypothetical protein
LNPGRWTTCALAAVLCLADFTAHAQSTNRPTRVEYTSFKLITDRNIFSPTRSGSRPMRYETRSSRTTSSRSDTFSLVGTMEYEQGRFAFFDGTSSNYRKTLRPNDTIAGYKLEEVSYNQVRLSQGTNTLDLKVGTVMRHGEDGDWVPSAPGEFAVGSPRFASEAPSVSASSPAPTAAAAPGEPLAGPSVVEIIAPPGEEGGPPVVIVSPGEPPAAPSSAAPAAPPAAGGENDVLRRLMQRREQELNR